MRVISSFVTLPFHAWLGVSIMSASTLIASDWYTAIERDWGASPMSDQQTAGGIIWISGDLIGLLVFGALFVQWVRASEREARREDRRLDRLEAAAARAAGPGSVPSPGQPVTSEPVLRPPATSEPARRSPTGPQDGGQ
jgi:putative copper resistance protein D